jgi:hypothetical protein
MSEKGDVCGWTQDGPEWTREAVQPIGSHDLVVESISQAILAKYRSYNADQHRGTVRSSWLKEQVDAYELPRLDEDVRKDIKELFDLEGIQVVE